MDRPSKLLALGGAALFLLFPDLGSYATKNPYSRNYSYPRAICSAVYPKTQKQEKDIKITPLMKTSLEIILKKLKQGPEFNVYYLEKNFDEDAQKEHLMVTYCKEKNKIKLIVSFGDESPLNKPEISFDLHMEANKKIKLNKIEYKKDISKEKIIHTAENVLKKLAHEYLDELKPDSN